MKPYTSRIYALLEPSLFFEEDIQEAIETFWDFLFPDYELMKNGVVGMAGTWLPDLVGVSLLPNQRRVLIIELKKAGTREAAVKQIVRYAREFHKVHPDYAVQLLVIGHWRVKKLLDVVKRDGYDIGVMRLYTLAIQLVCSAEQLLMSAMLYESARAKTLPVADLPARRPGKAKKLTSHMKRTEGAS